MLDYKGLEALSAVIQQQGFELAAKELCITQSAVSQRIKSLEFYFGQPLLIRTQPYRPTKLGEILLSHYRQTMLLEDSVLRRLEKTVKATRISIATNRDSLETWLVKVFDQLATLPQITLDIVTDDQEITLEYFKQGLVSACLSTSAKALTGCQVDFLGYMDYVLVASPRFQKKYFDARKNFKKNLLNAPAVIFDTKDTLHHRYVKHFFNIDDTKLQYHIVPSVHGFRQFALLGYGYALIPKIDIIAELKHGKLIELMPGKVWQMPLYWHRWSLQTEAYKVFNQLLIRVAATQLNQTKT